MENDVDRREYGGLYARASEGSDPGLRLRETAATSVARAWIRRRRRSVTPRRLDSSALNSRAVLRVMGLSLAMVALRCGCLATESSRVGQPAAVGSAAFADRRIECSTDYGGPRIEPKQRIFGPSGIAAPRLEPNRSIGLGDAEGAPPKAP